MEPHLEQLPPDLLALMAWALARASVGSKEIYQRIGDRALQRPTTQPMDLTNLLWAFATVKIMHPFVQQVRLERSSDAIG